MDLAVRFGRLAFSLGVYFSVLDTTPQDASPAPYSVEAPAPVREAHPVGFQATPPPAPTEAP